MAAITWRQLVSPDDSGAFKALHAAGDTINNGFEAVNRAITSRQLAGQTQEDIGRKTNVANYLDAVQQASTPEAAAALQNSPEMKALGASVDPRDRDLVRNAIEARLTSTRDNVTKGQTFQADQLLQQHLPVLNEAKAAYARGDQANGDRLMGTVPTNVRDYATSISAGMKDVEARNKFTDDILTAEVNRASSQSNALANTQNAKTNAGQLAVHQQQVNQTAVQQLEAQRGALAEKLATTRKGQFGSDEGQKVFEGAIKLAAGDNAPTILRLASEAVAKDPKYRNLPTDVVISAVTKHTADVGTGKWNPFDMGVANSIKADLEAAYKNTDVQAQMVRAEVSHAQIGAQLQALNGVSDIAMRRAFPEFGAGIDATLAKRQAEIPAPGSPAPGAPQPAAPQTPAGQVKSPQNSRDADMIRRDAELQRDEIAVGARKPGNYTPEAKAYWDAQAKDKQVSEVAAGDAAAASARDYRAKQIEKRLAASQAAASSQIGAFGSKEAQIAEVQRRRTELTKEIEAAKKAK